MKQLAEFRIQGLLIEAHEEVTKNGYRMVKAMIETVRTVKGQEKLSKLQITCLGQSGDLLLGLTPSSPVIVSGVIEGREWQKKDGGLGFSMDLIAFDILSVVIHGSMPLQPNSTKEDDLPF